MMKRTRRNLPRQAGFSVVEILVVCVVIAIIAALALIQRGTASEQFKRQGVARELKSAFERARFDSVKRRAEGSDRAYVVVTATTVALTIDANQDGDITDSGDTSAKDFSAQNITISSDQTTLPLTVTFDKRGEITFSDDPVFLVCNIPCTFGDTSTNNPGNANIVLVTPTGTVNLLAGGTAVPTFTAPTLTSVPQGNDINNGAAVTPTP